MSRARDTANQINRLNSSAADATAITVTSSENVGVGLSTNIASKLHVNSELSLGQDNNNRMIVGSTSGGVGSIGTIEGGTASFSSMTFKGGNVGIGTSNPTAKFSVAGSTSGDYLAKIESTNQFGLKIKTTSTSDSHEQFAIHDGNNNVQFKVMGGGNVYATAINLGGTGTANKLSDYEYGTWSPTVRGSSADPSSQPSLSANYIKIGRQVTISIRWNGQSMSGASGYVTIDGLPFTTDNEGIGAVMVWRLATFNTGSIISYATGTTIYFYSNNSGSGWNTALHTADTNTYLKTTVTYETNA